MLKLSDLKLTRQPDAADIRMIAAGFLGVPEAEIISAQLCRLSVDARRKPEVRFVCSLLVTVRDERAVLAMAPSNVSPYTPPPRYEFPYSSMSTRKRPPVIVGTGPAGLFAALCLAEAGVQSIILERGRRVEERVADVGRFRRGGGLDLSSNVQFGEGGAGTFSDGKLTTGINDVRVGFVLDRLVGFGAPESILYLSKPHIGTDMLRGVITAIRERLIELGCDIRFGHTLTDIDISGGALYEITADHGEAAAIKTDTLILAPGNSARDTFEMLARRGVKLSPKAFSAGVRIEHLQRDIDLAQYGEIPPAGVKLPVAGVKFPDAGVKLPAADYKLVRRLENGRSVYTFCVCPGGQVVAAASEQGGVVTNGMSRYARDGENCNSALLVSVTPDDYGYGPLDGIEFQRKLERAAFIAGGGDYRAPVQTVSDFLEKRASSGHNKVTPTYLPGVRYCNLWDVLPGFICGALYDALPYFSKLVSGFSDPAAMLTAIESRSSCPVRIERVNYETVGVRGIFPCGEGSGYAGGIMSSAVDGIKCAERIASAMCSAAD